MTLTQYIDNAHIAVAAIDVVSVRSHAGTTEIRTVDGQIIQVTESVEAVEAMRRAELDNRG